MPATVLEATPEETAFFESGGATVPESMKHLATAAPTNQDGEGGEGEGDGEGAPAGAAGAASGEGEGQAGAAAGAAGGGEGEGGEGEGLPAKGGDKTGERQKLERPVPFAAVLQERTKRQSAEERARQAEEALARIRAGGPQPGAAAPGQQQQQGEGEGLDPIGDIEALKQWRQQQEQSAQAQQQQQAFQTGVIQLEQHYAAQNPDYPEAVEFLKEARAGDLRAMGLNDTQIRQTLAREARETAVYAVQTEQNPAELFHLLAKQRGFVPKAKPGAGQGEGQGQGGEGGAAPAAAVARLDRLQRGQQAAKSLAGGGGGAAAATGPSLAAIANMNGEDFDKMWKNGTVKKLMDVGV